MGRLEGKKTCMHAEDRYLFLGLYASRLLGLEGYRGGRTFGHKYLKTATSDFYLGCLAMTFHRVGKSVPNSQRKELIQHRGKNLCSVYRIRQHYKAI